MVYGVAWQQIEVDNKYRNCAWCLTHLLFILLPFVFILWNYWSRLHATLQDITISFAFTVLPNVFQLLLFWRHVVYIWITHWYRIGIVTFPRHWTHFGNIMMRMMMMMQAPLMCSIQTLLIMNVDDSNHDGFRQSVFRIHVSTCCHYWTKYRKCSTVCLWV